MGTSDKQTDHMAVIRAMKQQGAPDDDIEAYLRQVGATPVERDPAAKWHAAYKTGRLQKNVSDLNAADTDAAEGGLETLAGGLRRVQNGLSLGFGQELNTALAHPGAAVRAISALTGRASNLSGEDMATLGREYEGQKAMDDQFGKNHPVAAPALEVAGAMLVPNPIKGGKFAGLKNAAILGTAAGMGNAEESRLGGGIAGAGISAATYGLLKGASDVAGWTGKTVGRMLRKGGDEEAALEYLSKIAAPGGGLMAAEQRMAEAAGRGGQPMLAEAVGESGLRGLKASQGVPLSNAGELVRGRLGERATGTLGRAQDAFMDATGSVNTGPQGNVRGPEYVKDWIAAIRQDETAPLYLRASAEAAAKESAPGMATARFQELLDKANVKALPGPGQSTVAKAGLGDAVADAEDAAAKEESAGSLAIADAESGRHNRSILRQAIEDFRGQFAPKPKQTVMQEISGEGVRTLRGEPTLTERPAIEGVAPPRQVKLQASNDLWARTEPVRTTPKPASAPVPTALDEAKALVAENPEVRSVLAELRKNPNYKAQPGSYAEMEAVYHGLNARLRDLTEPGSARARNTEQAVKALAPKFLKAMEEIAPTARSANAKFAELSVPDNSFSFGREFDKYAPEELDKAIKTGFLPDGRQADPESIKLGGVQRALELLQKRASSGSLEGAAAHKNAMAGLNSERTMQQLKVLLGDDYDDVVTVIRELLREEGTNISVAGGKNMSERLAAEGPEISDLFGAFLGGIGFRPEAAVRRTVGAAALGSLKDRAQLGLGKTAERRADMLSSSGNAAVEWIRKAQELEGRAGTTSKTRQAIAELAKRAATRLPAYGATR